DPAAEREHARRARHGPGEVLLELGEGGQDEIAETVTGDLTLPGEAEVEQVRHRRIASGERDQAVPDVGGGGNLVGGTGPSGAPAGLGPRGVWGRAGPG